MLAIGGWNEGSSRFSPMLADPARRKELVKNSIKFLRQNHFDGLDLDWEYPAFRDGGKPHDKNNYANFVQVSKNDFKRLKRTIPKLYRNSNRSFAIGNITRNISVRFTSKVNHEF